MFIAIVKRVGDLADKTEYKGYPDGYPIDCRELADASAVDALLAEQPSAEVFTLEQYKGMQKGIQLLFDHVQASKKRGLFARMFNK